MLCPPLCLQELAATKEELFATDLKRMQEMEASSDLVHTLKKALTIWQQVRSLDCWVGLPGRLTYSLAAATAGPLSGFNHCLLPTNTSSQYLLCFLDRKLRS